MTDYVLGVDIGSGSVKLTLLSREGKIAATAGCEYPTYYPHVGWFLTTNARPTKYCNGYAPGDKRNRSCRQVGNLKGRKERELAEDHPYVALYETRMNSIDHRLDRNRTDPALAKMMKKLAKDKMQRAKHSVSYANGKYIQEMELVALEAEARALL